MKSSPIIQTRFRKCDRIFAGRILKCILFCFVLFQKSLEGQRKRGSVVAEYIWVVNSLQCQVNYISTWCGPEERNDSASRECQKDLIIIFGKAMRSGSVMSLLRIALLIAFLDVRAFQMNGASFLLWLSFFLGWFPSWASYSSLLLLWYWFIFSLLSSFLALPSSTHTSFHSTLFGGGKMCECVRGECLPKDSIFSLWSQQGSASALTHHTVDDLLPCYVCYFCVSGAQKTGKFISDLWLQCILFPIVPYIMSFDTID